MAGRGSGGLRTAANGRPRASRRAGAGVAGRADGGVGTRRGRPEPGRSRRSGWRTAEEEQLSVPARLPARAQADSPAAAGGSGLPPPERGAGGGRADGQPLAAAGGEAAAPRRAAARSRAIAGPGGLRLRGSGSWLSDRSCSSPLR
ncbi:Serine/Threonine-Protein Kinase Mrck Alpha [Manis pentadactyla]|nr:Serine/Threonine-Protein Kinase Mrck Alpha [Manis pentadactyla]